MVTEKRYKMLTWSKIGCSTPLNGKRAMKREKKEKKKEEREKC
jgi:hypothetical protein